MLYIIIFIFGVCVGMILTIDNKKKTLWTKDTEEKIRTVHELGQKILKDHQKGK